MNPRLWRTLAPYVAASVLAVVVVGGVMWRSQAMLDHVYPAPAPWTAPSAGDPATAIVRGGRLVTVTACGACHGQTLTGHQLMLGGSQLYGPNLTRIVAKLSDAEIERALRHGLRPDGRSEVAMPSYAYAAMSDGDVADVIAYLRSLPAKGDDAPPPDPGFGARFNMAIGRTKLQAERLGGPPALDAGPAFAEGRHLASIACTQCHGPSLAGGPALPGPDLTVDGYYDLPKFRALMRTGDGGSDHDLGLMSRTAVSNFSHMTDAEIESLWRYLMERDHRIAAASKGRGS